MNFARTLRVPLALLLLLLAGHWLLVEHLQSASASLYPPMRKPLDELTANFKDWKWDTTDVRRMESSRKSRAAQLDQLLKNDFFVPETFLLRYYDCVAPPTSVSVSLVHSEKGFDRRHHPEICLGDAKGWREEPGSRAAINLLPSAVESSEARPVQRFRYRSRDLTQPVYTVYYWHYTVRPHDTQELSSLQVFNQLFRQAPPSVSLQVWLATPLDQITQREAREAFVEKSFLPALDAELRLQHLPAKVKMQSDRIVMGINR